MECKLAIVIPAFKSQFLSQSIASVVNQSCRNFNLYIGDDASLNDLNSIIEPFRKQIPIYYKRFEKNLGSVSLTRQWSRCISLSEREEFIWLFSDDDIMPADAVERFYESIQNEGNHDLYRFNLQFIDSENKIIRNSTCHPQIELSEDFLKRRFTFTTISSACEYIFRRSAYLKHNGFVEFPLAWCSDDATWAVFGRQNGIYTIAGRPISMRMSSGLNISSDTGTYKLKYSSVVLFVKWTHHNFTKDIDNKYFYLYLRSQINALSVTLRQRLNSSQSFLFLLNPVLVIALIINRSIIYKTADKLFKIEIS